MKRTLTATDAVRCFRRVFPLFESDWPDVDPTRLELLARALAEAEHPTTTRAIDNARRLSGRRSRLIRRSPSGASDVRRIKSVRSTSSKPSTVSEVFMVDSQLLRRQREPLLDDRLHGLDLQQGPEQLGVLLRVFEHVRRELQRRGALL